MTSPKYYKKIEGDLFDFEAYYLKIAQLLPDNCRIAEIGVANGKSATFLAEAIIGMWGKKIDRFVLIDNFEYGQASQVSTLMTHMARSGLAEYGEILQMDSLNASLRFPDNYFHFVFIDSAHTFELTKAEIRLWSRKVKDRWVLAGHDTHLLEVKQALRLIPTEDLVYYDTQNEWGVWHYNKNGSVIG